MKREYDFDNMTDDEIMKAIQSMPTMDIYTEGYIDLEGNSRTRIRRLDNDKILSDVYDENFLAALKRINIKYRYKGINPSIMVTACR